MTVYKVELKSSKFGKALVLSSSEHSGSYVLGFRLDPAEKLHRTHKELIALHKLHSSIPIFGVQFQHKVLVLSISLKTIHFYLFRKLWQRRMKMKKCPLTISMR